MSLVAQRFRPFGTSIFAEMSALATKHNAVNLAQGFPDFDGPLTATDAAINAIRAGHGQYAPMTGVPPLRDAIAHAWRRDGRGTIDPAANVTVTSGCSEGLVAAFLGLLNPGDEVVIFEPYFDFYVTSAAMAGAIPRFVRLDPPSTGGTPVPPIPGSAPAAYTFDASELRRAFTSRTRAVILNTPHNPTGKVYTREELSIIANLAQQHNAIVISDEVYEYLTYEPALPHISIATLPGMWERTITLSSIGKAFSLTGWRVGWAVAPEPLSACVRAAHQFLTFCAATPLQHGCAAAITNPGDYPATLRTLNTSNRDLLAAALCKAGLIVHPSHSTYFLMADHSPLKFADDHAFCTHLASHVGVAAIPSSAFYHDPLSGKHLARFAFCKKHDTIKEAVQRLEALGRM